MMEAFLINYVMLNSTYWVIAAPLQAIELEVVMVVDIQDKRIMKDKIDSIFMFCMYLFQISNYKNIKVKKTIKITLLIKQIIKFFALIFQ